MNGTATHGLRRNEVPEVSVDVVVMRTGGRVLLPSRSRNGVVFQVGGTAGRLVVAGSRTGGHVERESVY